MKVRRIRATAFMAYDEADVALPETGLVLITGQNGSGKSSLAEAVAAAYWGRTMRGTPFHRRGTPCQVEVETEELIATRKVTRGGSKSLSWSYVQGEDREFGTPSKAQAELDRQIPPLDVWRRTSVLSSHDASLFSAATDKVRKQLLEALLGIERFDRALKACRAGLANATTEARRAEERVRALDVRIEGLEERLSDAEEWIETFEDPGDLHKERARLARVNRILGQNSIFRRILSEERRGAGSGLARLETRLEQVRTDLDLLGSGDCPTCGQVVGSEILESLAVQHRDLEEELERARVAQEDMIRILDEREDGLDDERSDLHKKRDNLMARITQADRRREAWKGAQAHEARIRAELEAAIDDRATAAQDASSAAQELALLTAVEEVLGLKGVRAHILGQALQSLQVVASDYLSRLSGGGLRVLLNPYSELKGGGVSDSISLEVEGAGAGWGYKANSGGERRRVDLALLMALAQLSDSAHGSGDIWFDEALDALDSDGVLAVGEIVREMASARKVIVISHNPALVEDLRPYAALRLHVHGHQITEASARSA